MIGQFSKPYFTVETDHQLKSLFELESSPFIWTLRHNKYLINLIFSVFKLKNLPFSAYIYDPCGKNTVCIDLKLD